MAWILRRYWMLVAAVLMTSSVSFDLPSMQPFHHLATESEEMPYDRACFVPPSERPLNVDKTVPLGRPGDNRPFSRPDLATNLTVIQTAVANLSVVFPHTQLLLFDMSLPAFMDTPMEYLSFANGTCGVDVYGYFPELYLDLAYRNIILTEAENLYRHCSISDTNVTSHPWRFRVLTTGHAAEGLPSFELVPEAELSRLPSYWLSGLVLRASTDYFAGAGPQVTRCSIPYLQQVPQSQYNFNFTFQINGCPSGRYGGRCDQDCSCAEGVNCHSFSGVCLCPRGLQGIRCDQRDPQITVQQQQIYVPYGETFNLTCTTHGMTPAELSWTKQGRATPLLHTTYQEIVPYTPRPVVVTSTVHAHNTSVNGVYVCSARDESGTSYKRNTSVTVIAIPDPFIQVPQNQSALIGSNVTFTCKTQTAAGTVRWVKGYNQRPSQAAEINNGAGRYEVLCPSEGVSLLRIYGVEFSDEDVYRCYVGHTFQVPDLSYTEAVLVVNSNPQPECSFQDMIYVQSGETLTLQCLVRQAKPAPELTWNIEDTEEASQPVVATHVTLSDDNFSWDVNTSMTFVPRPEENGKQVSVTIVSPAGFESRELKAFLNVTYAPIVTVSPNPITVIAGQDATIQCLAQANPEPTGYVWTLRCHDKPAANVSTGTRVTLKSVGKEYDKASLTCLAWNEIGEMQTTVPIKVTENGFSTGSTIAFSVSAGVCLIILVVASFLVHRYRREITLRWAKRAGKGHKEANKEYDVFISYKSSALDEDFVVRELIPRLEQDGYRVCVHYRAFMPGRSIIDNISDAVHLSRKTLLLLSPGFVESEWCRYEFQVALSQMLRLQTDLIPVIFEDLGPPQNLSQDLQMMLRTFSYISWPGAAPTSGRDDKEGDRKRFWELLWQSLPEIRSGREGQVLEIHLGEEENAEVRPQGRGYVNEAYTHL